MDVDVFERASAAYLTSAAVYANSLAHSAAKHFTPAPSPPARGPIDWNLTLQRYISWSYTGQFTALKRIRRVSEKVYDDGLVARPPKKALVEAHRVIYAVYGKVGKRIYVGQTKYTAYHRMKQHVKRGRATDPSINNTEINQQGSLYRGMANYGWDQFGIVVLEVVGLGGNAAAIKKRLLRREKFWIERFASNDPHRGYNFRFHGFGKLIPPPHRHRTAESNPLKRRRLAAPTPVGSPNNPPSLPSHSPSTPPSAPTSSLLTSPSSPSPPPSSPSTPPPNSPDNHAAAGRRYGFRDGRRRLLRLTQIYMNANGPARTTHRLSTLYCLKSLLRMYRCSFDMQQVTPQQLQAEAQENTGEIVPLNIAVDLLHHITLVQPLILTEIQKRSLTGATRNQRKSRKLIVFPFTSDVFDKAKLSAIFQDETLMARLGVLRPLVGSPVVGFSYGRTSGQLLCNYTAALDKLDVEGMTRLTNTNCICKQGRYSQWVDAHHQHIITSDPSIITSPVLQALITKGTKYRDAFAENEATIIENIEAGVKAFIVSESRRLKVGQELFSDWKVGVIEAVKAALEKAEKSDPEQVDAAAAPCAGEVEREQKGMKRATRWLHRHFVVTRQDKADNTFVFVCKKHYCEKVWNEAMHSPTYKAVENRTPEAVAKDHGEWLMEDGLIAGPELIPSTHPKLYAIVKAHKTPLGFRYIAASSNATLTLLSQNLTRALQVLLPTVDAMWSSTASATGRLVKRSWIIPNSDSVVQTIRSLNQLQHNGAAPKESVKFDVWDFSTLYTKIPLSGSQGLKARLHGLIDAVFDFYKTTHNNTRHYIRLTNHREQDGWTSNGNRAVVEDEEKGFVWLNQSRLKRWVSYLVDNIFITVGDQFLQQIIGIPMGTNCAPLLANLYLFTFEWEYLKHLLATGSLDIAMTALDDCRYIDDVLFADMEEVESHLYTTNQSIGLYPKEFLTLELTGSAIIPLRPTGAATTNPPSINYMDLTITSDAKGIYTKIYDKRDHIPALANTLRFPHPTSRLSTGCKFAVITSQLYRYHTKCMRETDLIDSTATLLTRMITAGYSKTRVLQKARAFSQVLNRHFGATTAQRWKRLCVAITRKVKANV